MFQTIIQNSSLTKMGLLQSDKLNVKIHPTFSQNIVQEQWTVEEIKGLLGISLMDATNVFQFHRLRHTHLKTTLHDAKNLLLCTRSADVVTRILQELEWLGFSTDQIETVCAEAAQALEIRQIKYRQSVYDFATKHLSTPGFQFFSIRDEDCPRFATFVWTASALANQAGDERKYQIGVVIRGRPTLYYNFGF